MTILALLLLPVVGGLLSALAGRVRPGLARWVSLVTMVAGLGVSVRQWIISPSLPSIGVGPWLLELDREWIPRFGIRFHLGLDGLSLLLTLLTYFLGLGSVLASWRQVQHRVGFFYLILLWVLSGVIGVFFALDLFLFYFFWELMLVPMYFLIAIWGHENRTYAAIKFFLFTQAGGLLLLVGILGLVFAHQRATGSLTFGYLDLVETPLSPETAMLLMLAFLAAFLVKLASVPLHTWLPDAHTEAPTAGSVILAGLLLKTGAYGLIRFAVPLFPEAAARFAPIAMTLGAAGILYGAVLAFAQTDLKRLVAYTSVSHLGFVLLAVFAWNDLALTGAVMQMLCHGLSTGGLFIIVGFIDERIHTRDLGRMGGLWTVMPVMGAITMVLALASLGLPGLGNFVAEFLALFGAFLHSQRIASVSALGLVLATVYALWFIQKAFHGKQQISSPMTDLSAREIGVTLALVAVLVWLGIFPQPVLDTARPALDGVQELAGKASFAVARRP
jgi:NADH-quinone oxidoreductase subunit M